MDMVAQIGWWRFVYFISNIHAHFMPHVVTSESSCYVYRNYSFAHYFKIVPLALLAFHWMKKIPTLLCT